MAIVFLRSGLSNRLSGFAEYLNKSTKVYIEGGLRTRKWTNDKGLDRYITEIYASSMQILGHASRTEIEKSEAVKPIPQHTKLPKLTVMPDDHIELCWKNCTTRLRRYQPDKPSTISKKCKT